MNKKNSGISILAAVAFLSIMFSSAAFATPSSLSSGFNFTNATNYSVSAVYSFNSTWTNTSFLNNVTLGSSTNFTLGRPDGTITVYNFSTTPFLVNNTTTLPVVIFINFTQAELGPVGTYNFTFGLNVTNDTGTYTNVTSLVAFNISKAATLATLYLNGITANQTSAYPNSTINATAVSNVSDLYVELKGNASALLNNMTSTSFNTTLWGVSVYRTFSAKVLGNENYSVSALNTLSWNITKGTLNLSLTGSNVSYPNSPSVSGVRNGISGDSDVNYTLWRNNSLYNSSNSTDSSNSSDLTDMTVLRVAKYNYTFNSTGGANWTANATGLSLTNVTVGKGALNLTFTAPNVTYPSNTVVTIYESNIGDSDVNYTLWRNATLANVSIPINGTAPVGETILLGADSYIYLLNVSNGTFSNWTANATGVNAIVTVSKGPTSINLTLNGTAAGKSYYNSTKANFTAVVNASQNLIINITSNYTGFGILNGTTSIVNYTNLTAAGTLWNLTAWTEGNANYSSSLTTLYFNVSYPLTWSGNLSSTPPAYDGTTASKFNITWAGTNNYTGTVLLEGNWSACSSNCTLTNATFTGDIWNYTSMLPAGTYQWKIYAKDIHNLENSTDTWTFTISKGVPTLNITGSPSMSVTYPTSTVVTASGGPTVGVSGVTCTLSRPGNIFSCTAGTVSESVSFSAGTSYVYTFVTTANENWTAASTQSTLTIASAGTGSSGGSGSGVQNITIENTTGTTGTTGGTTTGSTGTTGTSGTTGQTTGQQGTMSEAEAAKLGVTIIETSAGIIIVAVAAILFFFGKEIRSVLKGKNGKKQKPYKFKKK